MSTLFDVGDMQRLERERNLTIQSPRQPPAEDRSPIEESIESIESPEPDFDQMLDGLLAVLAQRINGGT